MPIVPTTPSATPSRPLAACETSPRYNSDPQTCMVQLSSIGNAVAGRGAASARLPCEHQAFKDVVQYLREHGPQRLGLSCTDVIALHDAHPTLTDDIARQTRVLRTIEKARSLTDILACLGQPATTQAAASGVQALHGVWQDWVVQELCDTLISRTDPASNTEAMRARTPEQLSHNLVHLLGMVDGQGPRDNPLHALPAALQRSLTKGLIARIQAWARTFALRSSQAHPDGYEAAVRRIELTLNPPSLALIDRIPQTERDPLLNAMHMMLINNHVPVQDGTALDDASWDIFSSLLARNAVDHAIHAPHHPDHVWPVHHA